MRKLYRCKLGWSSRKNAARSARGIYFAEDRFSLSQFYEAPCARFVGCSASTKRHAPPWGKLGEGKNRTYKNWGRPYMKTPKNCMPQFANMKGHPRKMRAGRAFILGVSVFYSLCGLPRYGSRYNAQAQVSQNLPAPSFLIGNILHQIAYLLIQ